MLKEMAEKGERATRKSSATKELDLPKLADIGISRKQSSNWQKIAEIRMGELIKGIEPKYSMSSIEGTNRPHRTSTLPEGISKKQSHYARQLADNQPLQQEFLSKAITTYPLFKPSIQTHLIFFSLDFNYIFGKMSFYENY